MNGNYSMKIGRNIIFSFTRIIHYSIFTVVVPNKFDLTEKISINYNLEMSYSYCQKHFCQVCIIAKTLFVVIYKPALYIKLWMTPCYLLAISEWNRDVDVDVN